MSKAPKVLVMCLADPAGNPRPYRAIHLFAQHGLFVDTLSFKPSKNLPVEQSHLIPAYSLAIASKLYRLILSCLQRLLIKLGATGERLALICNDAKYALLGRKAGFQGKFYKLILVEDLQLLPFAFDFRGDAKILFDAREFYVRQFEDSFGFKTIEAPVRDFLLSKFACQCDRVMTVSDGLRDEYYRLYSLDMQVVRSTPPLQNASFRPTGEHFKMVHHGKANKNRCLYNMIEIVRRLNDNYSLDFYLVGSSRYIDSLRRKALGCGRIRFLPPVQFNQINPMLCNYDIGLCYFEPTTFNLTHCLPNKFFEFIQARLALAVGPSPDMARLVSKYECGFVSPEFTVESMVQTLGKLNSNSIDEAKVNSCKAAAELCYEREAAKLLSICNNLIGMPKIISPVTS